MKNALGTMFLVAVLLVTNNSFAHSNKVKNLCNFAPPNKMSIPVGLKGMNATGIDETTFNKVIDELSKYYAPIIAKKGGELLVNRKWSDPTVNASAQRSGKTWILNMYGGLARHQVMTADGFALVMCHELGHHLGGFPRIPSIFGSSWASNEGQADYFATMKCFRRVYEKADNASVVSKMEIPSLVAKNCATQHKSDSEIALCKRNAMGGLVLARLLSELGGDTVPVAFDTPDSSVVSKTDDQHPAAQCRLDTYFNGSTCGIAYTEDFGEDNAVAGACAEERGDKFGFRPRCWFKPKL